MQEVFDVAILGASGYTGAELIRLIATHPGLRIAALTADRKAGQTIGEVFPHLRHLELPRLTTIEALDLAGVDLAFCALPHATTQEVVARLPRDLKIVDLSADFRLRDPAVYERWYGHPHLALDLQAEAVYGLTEFYREEIRGARLVAGTGCNSATGLYGVLPLLKAGVIDPDEIIIDLATGVSGRRPLAQGSHAAFRGLRGLPRLQRGQPPAPGGVRPGVRPRRRPQGRGDLRPPPAAAEPRHPRDHLPAGRRRGDPRDPRRAPTRASRS